MSVVGSYPSTMMTAFMQPEEEGSAIVSGCPRSGYRCTRPFCSYARTVVAGARTQRGTRRTSPAITTSDRGRCDPRRSSRVWAPFQCHVSRGCRRGRCSFARWSRQSAAATSPASPVLAATLGHGAVSHRRCHGGASSGIGKETRLSQSARPHPAVRATS